MQLQLMPGVERVSAERVELLCELVLLDDPVGKLAPLAIVRGRTKRGTPSATLVTNAKTRRYEKSIQDQAEIALFRGRGTWGAQCPLDTFVELEVEIVKPRPKSVRGTLSQASDTKPDCDNVHKSIGDILERAGFVKNDARIWKTTIAKYVAAVGERPHVRVKIWRCALP